MKNSAIVLALSVAGSLTHALPQAAPTCTRVSLGITWKADDIAQDQTIVPAATRLIAKADPGVKFNNQIGERFTHTSDQQPAWNITTCSSWITGPSLDDFESQFAQHTSSQIIWPSTEQLFVWTGPNLDQASPVGPANLELAPSDFDQLNTRLQSSFNSHASTSDVAASSSQNAR